MILMSFCTSKCPTCQQTCVNNVAGHGAGNHLCPNEHSW